MRISDFLVVQLKRIARLVPGIMGSGLLALFLIVLAAKILIAGSDYEQGKQKIAIGVISADNSQLIDMGIYLLESYDDSRYMVEIRKFEDMEAARTSLIRNEIAALFEIPKDFYSAIDRLTNDSSITYYTASNARGVTGVYTDAITGIVSDSILYSEAGILSLIDYMGAQGYSEAMAYEETDKLFLKYVNALVMRGDLVEIKERGVSNGVGTYAYYLVGLVLFFVSVQGLGSVLFFVNRTETLAKLASARGVGSGAQVVSEFLAFYLGNGVCALVLLGILWKVAGLGELAEPVPFLGEMCISMLLIYAFEFVLFEIAKGTINKILISFLGVVGSAYVSGLLYPRSMLPKGIQSFGTILPTGVALSHMTTFMARGELGQFRGMILIYSIVLLGLSALLRFEANRGDRS